MIARRTITTALLALPLLGCDGVVGLRSATNDPDAGAAGQGGAGGRGGDTSGGVSGGGGAAVGRCLSGLLAYYPFDSDTKDHSGGGHDLAAIDLLPTPGVLRYAVAFNGSTSSARVSGGTGSLRGARTLCAWLKPEGVTGLAQPVFTAGDPGQNEVIALTSATPSTPEAPCMGWREGEPFMNDSGNQCISSGLVVPSGVWSFVCYLSDGSGTHEFFMIDGRTITGRWVDSVDAPLSTLEIGSNTRGGSATRPSFRGSIDEVSVWNRQLSLLELTALSQPASATACHYAIETCGQPPSVTITPGSTTPLGAGTTAEFDVAITDGNAPPCPPHQFFSFGNTSELLIAEPQDRLEIPTGETAHLTLHVSSRRAAQIGIYPFSYTVIGDPTPSEGAHANYVVGSVKVSTGIPLVPDGDGQFDGTNAAGVIGSWWSTGDAYGMDNVLGNGTCPQAGFPPEACSVLTTPTPGTIFKPDPNGRGMCTSGVSAQLIADGTGDPAWSSIWGNMIAFDLNNPGPHDGGVTTRTPYDAPAHGITGLAFDIDTVPQRGRLDVAFRSVATELFPAYWHGQSSPIFRPGHHEISWSELGSAEDPNPLDPAQLISIAFFVYGDSVAPAPFDFCVSNLMMLTN